MDKKVAEISPALLIELFADGRLIGLGETYVVSRGIPPNTTFVWAGYGGSVKQEGAMLLLLENPTWPETAEGGESIADQYAELGVTLARANVDRINGAARLLDLLGDVDGHPALPPQLSVFKSCLHFIEQIPAMVHSPTRSEDVRKVDCDDDGRGGDDAYDAGRYGLMVESVGVAASTAVVAKDPLDEMDGGLR